MLNSFVGTKVGMTQIFNQSGEMIPVTVISVKPCLVTDIRTKDKNGYNALQLGCGDVEEKSLSRPLAGQFKKKNIASKKYLLEFRVDDVSSYKIGQEIKADIFNVGDIVDISGVSKGKGFAGPVKRHNFSGGVQTHGQSDRQRAPGSSGGQGPQRVLKGARRAGHLGAEVITTQKLKVVGLDKEKNIMLIEGAVPGVKEAYLVIKKTVKKAAGPAQIGKTQSKQSKRK